METAKIKELLKKYYNAEGTDEEELILRTFFSEEEIPSELHSERDIFSYYTSGRIPGPEAGFEARIIRAAGMREPVNRKAVRNRMILSVLSVAAGVALLTGSYFIFIHQTEQRDTFSDPETAYAEAMKILYDVSSGMNYGKKALEPVGKMHYLTGKSLGEINKQSKIVENKLRTLGLLSETLDMISPE